MNDQLTTRLTRELHEQVEDWHETPLTFEGVQGRARTIRRRRQALGTGAVAAAVLAVAIPIGIGFSGDLGSTPDPANPSPTRMVEQPGPTPRADGTFRFALDVAEGPVPDRGFLVPDEQVWVTPGGEIELPGHFVQLVPFGDGLMGVRGPDRQESGPLEVVTLDNELDVVSAVATSSGIASTADGSRLAWVEQDGDRWTVVSAPADGSEPTRTEVPAYPTIEGFLTEEQVAVSFEDDGEFVKAVVGPDGLTPSPVLDGTGEAPTFQDVRGTSDLAGLVAGQTEFRGDSTCSQVRDVATAETVQQTCDFGLGELSPDGRWIIGYASYYDYGSPTLAILDATTLQPVVEFTSDRDPPSAVVMAAAWEDDDSVLAVVNQSGRQAVLRFDADGEVTRVSDQRREVMTLEFMLPGDLPLQNG